MPPKPTTRRGGFTSGFGKKRSSPDEGDDSSARASKKSKDDYEDVEDVEGVPYEPKLLTDGNGDLYVGVS